MESAVSDEQKPRVGAIGWVDISVPDAEALRSFYASVVGWDASLVDMGGYSDFVMSSPGSEAPTCGICHAKGVNADLPAQWLMYIVVADIDASAKACVEQGGALITEIKNMGGQGAVLRDQGSGRGGGGAVRGGVIASITAWAIFRLLLRRGGRVKTRDEGDYLHAGERPQAGADVQDPEHQRAIIAAIPRA